MATAPHTPAGTSAGAPVSSAAPALLERTKNILLTPKTEWPLIAPEPTTAARLYTGYVIPLAALAAVVSLVHMSIIGFRVPLSGTIRAPLASGLTSAILTFAFGLVGLFLVGLIIDALAPSFGGTRGRRQALKTAAYAFTPAWVGTLFSLLPALSTLLQLAAGIYGVYLLHLGLLVVMKSPRDRAFGYTATVVLCAIVIGIVFGIVSAATPMSPFGAFGRSNSTAPVCSSAQASTTACAGARVAAMRSSLTYEVGGEFIALRVTRGPLRRRSGVGPHSVGFGQRECTGIRCLARRG
jgi:Yip1 domain